MRQIVGGQGAAPTRFYVVSNVVPSRNPTASTAVVFRSENGVDGWTQLASIPDARGEGLAFNPAVPDQVFVGLKDGRVLASTDGGQSWAQLGQPVASIYGLVLGIDGRNLYAATVDGVW